MNVLEKSLQSLEWHQVLEHYSEHCASAPAKDLSRELPLAENIAEAEQLLLLTEQSLIALEEESFSQLSSLDKLDAILLRLEKQAVLDGKEIYSLYRLFEIVKITKEYFSQKKNPAPTSALADLVKDFIDFSHQQKAILHALEPDGRVKDSASLRLGQLRSDERRLHNEARDKLENIVQKAFRDGYLQDRFFDVRDGRYLVPVKNEFRNKLPGLIVESSASKASVFVEPAALRDINDRIKQTQLFIEEEIYTILKELSEKLYPIADAIDHAYEQIIIFDLTIARGKFANALFAVRGSSKPTFADTIYLEGIYHPLLAFVMDKEKIIRNHFYLDQDKNILIISGPNTGGKTVLLKSVGLAALMARAGFYLSCAGQAQIPFFTKVLVQIGDAQSIELSLSSFSASIVMLKEILESSDDHSLVLIDEILHATDPDEASALSQSILQHLNAQKTTAIITTHLNGLKVSQGSQFMSASMEFDTALMQPSYRLRLGIPGSSRALEIGEKLGLPKKIIDVARMFLGKNHSTVNDLLNQLEDKERELESERANLLAVREKAQHESERLESLNSQLAEQKKNFRSQMAEKIQQMERESLQKVEEIIALYKSKLQDIGERHQEAIESKKRIQEIRDKFQATKENLELKIKNESEPTPALKPANHFEQNGNVFVKHLKSNGILLSSPEQTQKPAEVLVGNMKIRVEWSKLSPLSKNLKPISQGISPYSTGSGHSSGDTECPSELNLLGKNSEDAARELSSYLDRAARSGKPNVRIIHGFGTGTIKKVVRDILQNSDYEIKFRAGKKEEGGDGCTVVEFY